jgi:hypothetical protein
VPSQRNNFRFLYCQKAKCRPARFNLRVFWHCLHRSALPIAVLTAPFLKVLFRLDFAAIEDAGNAESYEELAMVVSEYTDRCRLEGGFLHQRLQWRISGNRLLKLGLLYLPRLSAASKPITPSTAAN